MRVRYSLLLGLMATLAVMANKLIFPMGWRGMHSTEVVYLLLTQKPQVRIPAFPIFFSGNFFKVTEVNQQRWWEESGQWLENVDRTHLVLASGKPVQQKLFFPTIPGRRQSARRGKSCSAVTGGNPAGLLLPPGVESGRSADRQTRKTGSSWIRELRARTGRRRSGSRSSMDTLEELDCVVLPTSKFLHQWKTT